MPSCLPSPAGASPRVQLLSNGRYTVMLTAAGSGCSSWRRFAVTRWREDPVGDGWGSYLLVRDEKDGDVWSAGLQPCGIETDVYTAELSDGHVGITRRHGMLATTLDVAVACDRDAELRRITLTNHGATPREITLTSYAELVLGPAAADAAHPAFSKMFVQTEWVEQVNVGFAADADACEIATLARPSLAEQGEACHRRIGWLAIRGGLSGVRRPREHAASTTSCRPVAARNLEARASYGCVVTVLASLELHM